MLFLGLNIAINPTQSANIFTPITGSTANAILLDIPTFINYKKYSFKASANSTGNVTINGKVFKKLDGTQIGSGGIKLGKVYDFYYDSASNSVFILAKAEGDVTAADVLAGKIYSSGDEIGSVGTMPNITADQTSGTISQSGTTVSLLVPKGYWDGTKKLNAAATAIDSDIVSGNIKAGANICGVAGATNVVDTTISSNAAVAANIQAGYKCYANGALITGTAPTKAAATITPGTANQTIASGTILTGVQTILGDADLIAANILSGKNIFGVIGSAAIASANSGTITFANSGWVTITASLIGFYPDVVIVNTTGPSQANILVLGRNVIINDPFLGGTAHQYVKTQYGRGTATYSDDIETPYSAGYSGYSGTFVTTWQAYKFI